ncbi:MAG TPA: hydrogenase maturation protease [Feifaniaceae bacterium]|nr:hydrogenase maturation protease [Feifaniaceae bacterium]
MDRRPLSGAARAERLLVLGMGSRLMRDDGIGPALIDALQREPCPGRWALCAAETDIACAADLRMPGDCIVLVDAVKTGNVPGTVHVAALRPEGRGKRPVSPHDPGAWRMVFEEPHAGGWLVGVEAYDISPGIGLSDTLCGAFPEIYARVRAQIEEIARASLQK